MSPIPCKFLALLFSNHKGVIEFYGKDYIQQHRDGIESRDHIHFDQSQRHVDSDHAELKGNHTPR